MRFIGVTPNEVLFDGVPLWKSRTDINWLPNDEESRSTFDFLRQREMPTSNTKSVIISTNGNIQQCSSCYQDSTFTLHEMKLNLLWELR